MGQPHKHAELIKLWADGAEIQRYSPVHGWQDIYTQPLWNMLGEQFRIKPKTIKYRLYMWKADDGIIHVNTAYPEEKVDNSYDFIKWLGDWQEVEV